MVTFILALAAGWWSPDLDPKVIQLEKDLAALEAAKADKIAPAVAKCAIEKVQAYHPSEEQLGKSTAGDNILKGFLDECGYESASAQIKKLLKNAAPTDSELDLDRKVASAFVFPVMALIKAYNVKFQMPSRQPVPPPVEIPLPQTSKPEPGANGN